MKFSNEEKKLAEFIFTNRNIKSTSDDLEANLKPFKNILVENIKDTKTIERLKELLKYLNKLDYYPMLELWPIPQFPITGEHLIAKNVPKGALFSKILNTLKEEWKNEHNFCTSPHVVERLLTKCDELIVK